MNSGLTKAYHYTLERDGFNWRGIITDKHGKVVHMTSRYPTKEEAEQVANEIARVKNYNAGYRV